MKNLFIICPFITLIICQIIKIISELIKNKRFDKIRIIGSGGMPSSHASFTSSLTFLIGYTEGFNSAIFTLAFVFMLVICYDAISVRYETGLHAEILNKQFNLKMKEHLGHKLLEVVAGVLLGLIVASVYYVYVFL